MGLTFSSSSVFFFFIMPLPTLSYLDLTEYRIPNTVFSFFGYYEGTDFKVKERENGMVR